MKAVEKPTNSKMNVVGLFFRYWDNITSGDERAPYMGPALA
jgi:hypothetical protein